MTQHYIPGYPRPQFARTADSWINLNGSWDFAFDDKNEGLVKKWYLAFPKQGTIQVPFSYETPASGVGDESRHDAIWYCRRFSPEGKTKSRILLHFEGCDYNTSVWINGTYAGDHRGACARFSFDITELVKTGENTIVVKAADSFDLTQPRGKQRWKNENFACWYVQTTGIWKTVWLEYVSETYIKSVKMTPVLQEGVLEIEADLCLDTRTDTSCLGLEAAVSFGRMPVAAHTAAVFEKHVRLTVEVGSHDLGEWPIQTWSPEHPCLYDIRFTLLREGQPLDRVYSYFGMREIRIEGSRALLNGVPLYQRLILDQGYWKESHLTPPDEQALVKDIDSVIRAGYNGVRKHQKIEDERFLYWADVKGLLVWSEMAAAYEFNDDAVENFSREWSEIVRQNYNHPSIITWTPFNESWGVPQIKTNITQQRFTEAIYNLTKAYDRFRPVICNDGWEHTISDIITLHDYVEEGEEFFARYGGHLEKILANKLCHNLSRKAFAEGYAYKGQPVIISEFGGVAFNKGDKGWGYGNKVNTKEEYLRRFDAITTAIRKVGAICGYCYTQLTDVQQEINGIMDMERNFKVEPELLKEVNERTIRVCSCGS